MRARVLGWGLAGLAGLLTTVWLSWVDVLPGGWTLRGWVEPHEQRAERARLAYEAERRAEFAKQRETAAPGVIFFGGSSTIERFPYDWFEADRLLNRGINDEPLEHFAARWEASLPTAPIGGAVLYLGSVDFRRLLATPEQIGERARALLAAWRTRFPELPILVLGIYPEQDMPEGWAQRLRETNQAIQAECAAVQADFLDLARPPLVNERGDLHPAYAADFWHMNRAGYAQALRWLADLDPAWLERLRPLPGTPADLGSADATQR